MTSPMEEALHRTTDAVERYRVPPQKITIAAKNLKQIPDELRRETEFYSLAAVIGDLAVAHGGPHECCLTCLAMENVLALAMGYVRTEADLAMARMIGE